MIRKRQKRSFALFSKHFPQSPNIRKFNVRQIVQKPRVLIPKIQLDISSLWKIVRQSEITFIIALSVGLFFVLLFFHYFFMITKVVLKDESGRAMNDWSWEGAHEIRNNNILLLSESAIEQIVTRTNPAIASVWVVKLFPQTVELVIRLQKPVVYLTQSATRYFILSSEGVVLDFAYEKPRDMGEIRYYQAISPGEYARGKPLGSRDVRFASRLGGVFHKFGYRDFQISVEDSHVVRCTVEDMVFMAASDSDHDKQVSAIHQLLLIVQKAGERFKSADVRFEKIIIGK